MEEQKKEEFIKCYFGDMEDGDLSIEEQKVIDYCLNYVNERFSRMKYILGTGIDFVILAQLLSNDDSTLNSFRNDYDIEELFDAYNLIKERGQMKANTLSLSYNKGKSYGIRKIEEAVLEFFHSINRTDYPSAYVYNTGQWQKYQDLLVNTFKLSNHGRLLLVKKLLDFGTKNLTENSYYNRKKKRIRLFETIISSYPRGFINGENGGLIFQAIAFGYYSADFPHLSIVVDKVRTGSSRQKRFGDIDCYFGLDLEISIEVKDFLINNANCDSQLYALIQNIQNNNILGIAFVHSIEQDTFQLLKSKGVSVVAQDDLLSIVSLWDWQKQNRAVQGILHYLAHVEQNPDAVKRLLIFIKSIDAEYEALEFI